MRYGPVRPLLPGLWKGHDVHGQKPSSKQGMLRQLGLRIQGRTPLGLTRGRRSEVGGQHCHACEGISQLPMPMSSGASRVVGSRFGACSSRLRRRERCQRGHDDSVMGDAYKRAAPDDALLTVSVCSAHATGIRSGSPRNEEAPSEGECRGVLADQRSQEEQRRLPRHRGATRPEAPRVIPGGASPRDRNSRDQSGRVPGANEHSARTGQAASG